MEHRHSRRTSNASTHGRFNLVPGAGFASKPEFCGFASQRELLSWYKPNRNWARIRPRLEVIGCAFLAQTDGLNDLILNAVVARQGFFGWSFPLALLNLHQTFSQHMWNHVVSVQPGFSIVWCVRVRRF